MIQDMLIGADVFMYVLTIAATGVAGYLLGAMSKLSKSREPKWRYRGRFDSAFDHWDSTSPVVQVGAVHELERLMTEWDELGRTHVLASYADMLSVPHGNTVDPDVVPAHTAAILDALRRQRSLCESLPPMRLVGARLDRADLRDIHLAGANLTKAKCPGADLRGANLARATMRNANLTNADLRGANLAGADLRGASLYGVQLEGADLDGADLTDAHLAPEVRAAGIPSAIGVERNN